MARVTAAELPRVVAGAARRLLRSGGPRAVTHRALAAEAGVSTTSLANRFGSIDDVFDYVALRAFAELTEAILDPGGRPLTGVGGPEATLAEALDRYRQWAMANPEVHRQMFAAPAAGRTPSPATRHAAGQLSALFTAAGGPGPQGWRRFVVVHGQVCLELSGLAFPPLSSNP